MPFAFSWTNVDPADPTAANLLGKDIRDLRAAIQERMDSVFCDPTGSWANSDPTHPLVVAPAVLGNSALKVIVLHHAQFKIISGTTNLSYNDQYVQNTDSSGFVVGDHPSLLIASVTLPLGVTITNVGIMVDPRNAGSVAAALEWYSFFGITPVTNNIVNIASGGVPGVIVASQGVAFTVNSTMAIVLRIALNNVGFSPDGNRFYAAAISYSTPDCRSTL